MSHLKSFVAITYAQPFDYSKDYVSLPRNYGSKDYYQREDIKLIIDAVYDNLTTLDKRIGFTADIKNRKVVIKPNLVTVFHKMGFIDQDYPNTTDPRVLDAVILFLKNYTKKIIIAESSGRSVPTRGSFVVSRIDKIAKKHKIKCMCLDEEPVDRYLLPKAKVMKETTVPRVFSEIAAGETFYISMPKLKTNLYTDVTLGFKNGMGCLTHNQRQRDHHFDIDQKLVDMLYLFKPNIVIIDGIVGAEGQCPAPVLPVKSNVIISGNNPVETDKVATRMMGIDPGQVKLIKLADESGFGDSAVEVIGDEKPIPFQKADPSLMNDSFHRLFPNVRVLIGHQLPHSRKITKKESVTVKTMLEMELDCRGGCLATTRVGFEYYHFEGLDRSIEFSVILGCGVDIDGEKWYFDRDGKPYSLDDINILPGKKLAIGSCSETVKEIANTYLKGCMIFPNAAHMAIHDISGNRCKVVNPITNPSFMALSIATLKMRKKRTRLIRKGHWLDCDLQIDPPTKSDPNLSTPIPSNAMEEDYIKLDFPKMSKYLKLKLIKDEWEETLNLFL